MSYNFEFNSPAIGRIQPFEYAYATTNEYAFTYGRDIFSDLSKFNAPIFVERKERGFFSYRKKILLQRMNDTLFKSDILHATPSKNNAIVPDDLLGNKDIFNLEIYDSFSGSKDIKKSEISKDKQFEKDEDIYVNIISQLLASKDRKESIAIKEFFGEKDKVRKVNISIIKSSKPYNEYLDTNIYDNYFLNSYDIINTNVFPNITANTITDKINTVVQEILGASFTREGYIQIYKDFLAYKSIYKKINLDKIISLYKTHDLNINILEQEFAQIPWVKGVFLDKNFSAFRVNDNNLDVGNVTLLSKENIFSLDIFKKYTAKKDINRQTQLTKGLFFQVNSETAYINHSFVSVFLNNIDNARLNKELNTTAVKRYKDFTVPYEMSRLAKYKRNSIKSKDIILGYHAKRKFSFKKENLFIYKFNNPDVFLNRNIIYAVKFKHDTYKNTINIFYDKISKETWTKDYTKFLYKNSHYSMTDNTNTFLYKKRQNFKMAEDAFFIYKDRHSFKIEDTTLYLYKDGHDFEIKDTVLHLDKSRHGFVVQDKNVYLRKRNGFRIEDTGIILHRDRNGFEVFQQGYHFSKARKGFDINVTEQVSSKVRKGFVIDNYTELVYKKRYFATINITETTIDKIEFPLGIIPHDNTIGFILSEKRAFIENDLIHGKPFKNAFTEDTSHFLDKEEKHTGFKPDSLFVITKERRAFLEYYHMVSRKDRDTVIESTNTSIEKTVKNGIIYSNNMITKKNRDVFIPENLFIHKKVRNLFFEEENFIDKVIKDTNIIADTFVYRTFRVISSIDNYTWFTKSNKVNAQRNNIFINKNTHETNIINDIVISKKDYNVNILDNVSLSERNYIVNIWNNVSLSKKIYGTNFFEHYIRFKKELKTNIYDNDIFVSKRVYEVTSLNDDITINKLKHSINENEYFSVTSKEKNAYINDFTFISREQYESNLFVSEMTHMQKIIKDLERPVNKTYNWVYVYQYEDPIDPNYDYYGLDELLLPEKDVNYRAFEDVIFDKITMQPRSPVKIIDDNTFIAKYPIKHPTPNYEDVGIVYVDVPSELMYSLFTKFYQIWYANIFKFGNMSMVESLNLMLEYMYAHIVTTYSGSEYLEPALRVFRQIRWFGETSVMHNAQYKISYEYEDLKSNLHTGECKIKNDLVGFYVNNSLKVLSTEPTSIGQGAYIKLYVSNKEDTQMYFSISLTGGNVEVYINDVHVDTIYSNHSNISYELPATDSINLVNEIVLKRSASNNIGNCYIGNIVIKKGTYKNLNIEYDPELKAGNMPLNDIVNKMVILANMYDNEQEVFEQFRKGNLAVSELYKRLESYWELHHANKIKGKRLTIKET